MNLMNLAKNSFFLLAAVLCAVSSTGCAQAAPDATLLSENGKAHQSIVVSANAAQRTKAAAATLADYLGRISGAKFEVQTGGGKSGLAVGTAADFPALSLAGEFKSHNPTQREDYILRSHAEGVLLLGASEQAVEHAVWDFLHRVGYRQFFPGVHWEIVPSTPALRIAVNAKEHPDYQARRIWPAYGSWPGNESRIAQWDARNRAVSGIVLNTGHAYDGIIRRNKSEFEKHPEYLTKPGGNKFCVSNSGLRQLVIRDALKFFADNPDADSYSVDPSDGGGWESDSCSDAKVYKNVSDRVLTLANEVAAAVEAKYPGKIIGFYAYNEHSPPPTVRAHPNVVVSVATAFLRGGFTVDELTAGWQKQGATLGVREYYSIIHWDKDLPNAARASDLSYLQSTIPKFHRQGARFMSAESSDNWGPNGLGFYIAARLLWDVDEAAQIDAIVEDFLQKSFGPARAPMEKFYELLTGINNAPKRPFSEDLVGRLYRQLDAALKTTDDTAIRARIGDLAMYVRFLELYRAYTSSEEKERLGAFEKLIRHSYRHHPAHMAHSLAQYRTRFRDRSFEVPKAAFWQVAEKDKAGNPLNPWKSSEPFTQAEVRQIVDEGVKNNQLAGFEAKTFSADLVPATPLKLPPVAPSGLKLIRGTQDFYLHLPEGGGSVTLHATAGTIYQNRGNAKLQLFAPGEAAIVEGDDADGDDAAPIQAAPLDQAEVPPDKQEYVVVLKSPRGGVHRLRLTERNMGTILNWNDATLLTMPASLETPATIHRRGAMYFYVPKGATMVGGFANGAGRIRDAANEIVFELSKKPEYFKLPVKPGQDGKLWKFDFAVADISLMTVPPYLARSEKELLLPREVVEADAKP